MAIQRIFLGQDAPALPAAADWLLTRFTRDAAADLGNVSVFVPGSRAARRLLELLVERGGERAVGLTPPQITTVGQLPEQLYTPKRPFATELVQRLVWAEVLQQATPARLQPVLPHPPAKSDLAGWLAVGDLLRRQHRELAADGLNFGHVAQRGAQLDSFTEKSRWKALQKLQEAYWQRLDALELWDLQTARLEAVKRRECHTDRELVLVGAVDLNVSIRQMLDQVADRVTSLVFAPSSWEDRFDSYGCLIPAVWERVELPIKTQHIEVVDGPADQAEGVARAVAGLGSQYRGDEVVIGVPDETLVPDLERRLAASQVTARWGPGQPFSQTAPFRLLAAVASYLESEQYRDFAALIRHPDLEPWVAGAQLPPQWLEQMDQFQNEHLPFRLASTGSATEDPPQARVSAAIRELLGGLLRPPQRLSQWADPIWQLVLRVYGQRPLHLDVPADRIVQGVCEQMRDGLQEQIQTPEAIMPQVSAAQAVRWLLERVAEGAIPAALTTDAIEMLGWLELPLDDSPVLIVTSMNEGFVPESLNSDLFLPNALRQQLGLLDNVRRYARDAYAVSAIVAGRRSVHWLVGRRNQEGDPLAPSRLLFACDPEATVERALQCFHSDEGPVMVMEEEAAADRRLAVPRPRPLAEPITSLRVTAFRDYITCPYRFYLKHVEKLEPITDSLDELDGRGFGNLAHEVLQRFGLSRSRNSTDPEVIRQVLEQALDDYAGSVFGPDTLPAVFVQVEQLRWRLRAFAERQAEWARQGWQIEHAEHAAEKQRPARIIVDGEPFQLTGRIDRIDIHRTTGERVIWDYKTGDVPQVPQKTHQCGDQWQDLQLPLYRYLAESLGLSRNVKLGYILLPKDTTKTQFVLADWTPAELVAADELAQAIVREIRRENFFPPKELPSTYSDDFAAICQTGVFR